MYKFGSVLSISFAKTVLIVTFAFFIRRRKDYMNNYQKKI